VTRKLCVIRAWHGCCPRPCATPEGSGARSLEAAPRAWRTRWRAAQGQALPLVLVFVVLTSGFVLALAAVGAGLTGKGRLQRAADLAALAAGRTMARNYHSLFVAPTLPGGRPNPLHLSDSAYRSLAERAAVRTARANGAEGHAIAVEFGAGFAPTTVAVTVRGTVATPLDRRLGRSRRPRARARAAAAIVPPAAVASALGGGIGGGYDGPLAYRQGKPMRPDVAAAFDRLAAAAWREARLALIVNSAFRSDAEQARLYAANPNPRWVAPPGTSLHRYATELDLGPPAAWPWLAANARRFGFIKRYHWEPWHYGYGPNPRDRQHPAQYDRGSWEPPAGDHSRIHSGLPDFVPPRVVAPIARAAQRWNVSPALLAAQLYVESGFNPFARSPAGALGIAQFMPATARAYGLRDPFDPWQAIDAQARLVRDLLDRFAGSVPLALAAYNAGTAAVERYGGIPPYPETRAYVMRILGLLGGVGEVALARPRVALIE